MVLLDDEYIESLSKRASVGRLVSGTLALELIADSIRFREFLKKFSINNKNILQGIKLALGMIIDYQIYEAERGTSFNLESDMITHRAAFLGLDIRNVRTNSQRAKVLRGLRIAEEQTLSENTIPDLQAAISENFKFWIEGVNHLFKNHVTIYSESCKTMQKKDVRTLQTFSWLVRFLNVKQHVHRYLKIHDYFDKKGKSEKQRISFEKAFLGYKTSISYLWHSLASSFLPDAPVDVILNTKTWDELDELFDAFVAGPIGAADEQLGDSSCRALEIITDYDNKHLESMMIEIDLLKDEEKDIILDHSFLWYDIEVLDTAGSKLFTGVPTFITQLLGSLFLKKVHDLDDPIQVRRILHPLGPSANDVSYAILIPMFGTFSDMSGWLVNLDCCNDSSGFARSLKSEADGIISINESEIAFEEILIEKDYFRKYLQKKIEEKADGEIFTRLTPSEQERIDLRKSIEISTDLSAVIMELFIAVILAERKYTVHWQFTHGEIVGEKEIDVIAYNDREVQIIECSRTMPLNEKKVAELIRELKRKKTLVTKSEFKRKKVLLRYITSKDIDSEPFKKSAQALQREGISVENIHSIMQKTTHHTKPLEELLRQIVELQQPPHSRQTHRKSPRIAVIDEIDLDKIRKILQADEDEE